jgi:alkanesulfonate monooxygenase SsuD/methylene tetrahydromethanopterin reductase-like flavin-dependent oxidoreductase (luciferase family)
VPVVIGAAGEKRGLRLAARHADIWQWFAGTDEVELFRHKDRILREHCDAEGRDERQIERMIGCKFILRSSPDEARRVAAELIAVHRWTDSIMDVVWAGTPQQVADWLTPLVEAGCGVVQSADRLAVRPRDHRAPDRGGEATRRRADRLSM